MECAEELEHARCADPLAVPTPASIGVAVSWKLFEESEESVFTRGVKNVGFGHFAESLARGR